MIRTFLAVFLSMFIGVTLFIVASGIPFGQEKTVVGMHYLNEGLQETGATNIVTSIVVLYRGFDTLGEVTVLFLAATGLGAILFGMREEDKEKKKVKTLPSLIMQTQSKFLFSMIILFGAYIFVHGHLTPGGGFPGGVVIASGFLLMFLAHKLWDAKEKYTKITESIAGITYVTVGLVGLFILGSFLENFLPEGIPNHLFSAGIIPVIYTAVGFKVGSELTGLLQNMKESL